MSIKQMTEIECSRCRNKGKTEVWRSINVQLNPEAMRELLYGRINLFYCRNCGFEVLIPTPLFYHDPLEKFCAEYVPFHWAKEYKFLDSLADDAKLDNDFGLPENEIPEYFKSTHIVFSMDELARYVVFRHFLALRKLSIKHGKLVCFSCGHKIGKGEHLFCVARRHQVRCDINKCNKEQILEATASLQICAYCMARAATETIKFADLPLPVLNLEKDGLHRFARWLVDKATDWVPIAIASDSCHLCNTPILAGNRYTIFEVSEEIEGTKGIQVKEAHTLAVLCEDCGQKYAVWL